jgi:hypothetical protein
MLPSLPVPRRYRDRTVVLCMFMIGSRWYYVILICLPLWLCCCSIMQGAAGSQPLSVNIPPERSITPVLQDFMDPNMFYLPAYYYGGEGPSNK